MREAVVKKLAWTSLLAGHPLELHDLMYGGTLTKHIQKVMVKGTYQLPPRIRMELLHSNIWWLDKVELQCKISTHAKGRNYITSLCPFLPNVTQ